jgi:hypothetical protein
VELETATLVPIEEVVEFERSNLGDYILARVRELDFEDPYGW